MRSAVARVDEVTRQEHLHGVLGRHVARQGHHGRRAEQADVHAGGGEARVLRGHGQVRAGHQLGAGGGGDAVDPGDDRLGEADHGHHHLGAFREQPVNVGRIVVAGPQFLEVVARAEGRTGARQDHDPDRGVSRQFGQGRAQGPQHAQAQAVARLGAVKGQGRDALVVGAEEERRFAHGQLP